MGPPVTSENEGSEGGGGSPPSESKKSNSKGGNASTTSTSPAAAGGAAQGPRPLLASAKRPLMTHSKDGKLLSEKKLRRLEKNRLSARECRRRKREATEHLERQINVLEGENLRLRLQLQIGEEAEDKMNKEQEKVTEGIVDLLESGASEAEIYTNIEEFKEKFADYGRDRRSGIEFHLRNIERLLMPTQTTTIAMRALQGTQNGSTTGQQHTDEQTPDEQPSAGKGSGEEQKQQTCAPAKPDCQKSGGTGPQKEGEQQPSKEAPAVASVTSSSTTTRVATPSASATNTDKPAPPPSTQDPKALFQYLVNYLEVSPEQAAALKDSRFVAQELDSHLEKALKVLEELKSRLTKCGEDLEAEFDNVRSILTPTQAAKFLVWVANNGACMHMLNELWGRAYGLSNDLLDSVPSESPDQKEA